MPACAIGLLDFLGSLFLVRDNFIGNSEYFYRGFIARDKKDFLSEE